MASQSPLMVVTVLIPDSYRRASWSANTPEEDYDVRQRYRHFLYWSSWSAVNTGLSPNILLETGGPLILILLSSATSYSMDGGTVCQLSSAETPSLVFPAR